MDPELFLNRRTVFVAEGLSDYALHVSRMNVTDGIPTVIEQFPYRTAMLRLQSILDNPTDYGLSRPNMEFPYERRVYMPTMEAILDPRNINLINMPLEEALTRHPSLRRSFDVVADIVGVSYHGSIADLNQLLSEGGRLITFHPQAK